jgi:hypothetical protein
MLSKLGCVGGQTREHVVLARSLGKSQLIVAVNKLDVVDWSQERFDEIKGMLEPFLVENGFQQKRIQFVPTSGLQFFNPKLSCTLKISGLCRIWTHPIDAVYLTPDLPLEAGTQLSNICSPGDHHSCIIEIHWKALVREDMFKIPETRGLMLVIYRLSLNSGIHKETLFLQSTLNSRDSSG